MDDIVIRADTVKRTVYLIPIIILIGIVAFQFFYPRCSACSVCGTDENKINSNSVSEISDQGLSSGSKEIEDSSSETVDNGDSSQEESEQETESQEDNNEVEETEEPSSEDSSESSSSCITTDVSNKVEVEIKKITYTVKGEDWAKVTKVQYNIKNGKKDFKPILRIFVYDDDDNDIDKGYYKEITLPDTLEKGCQLTKESITSFSYNDIDKVKTVKMQVLDSDSSVLDSTTKSFETS